jgi:hypothetical protein
MTRARPSRTPVTMPEKAVGRTTREDRLPLRHPEGVAASRSSFGTSLSISSVERTTTGIISRVSERQTKMPARCEAEGRDEDGVDEEAGDDRRHAGEDVDHEADDPGEPAAAVLHEIDRGQHPDRHRDQRGDQALDQRALDGVDGAATLAPGGDALLGVGPPRRVEDQVAALDCDSHRIHTSGMTAMAKAAHMTAVATEFLMARLPLDLPRRSGRGVRPVPGPAAGRW